MPWARYVLAYHGCDAEVAARIVSGIDSLMPSTNEYDWLGHGLYFWEESLERALLWAREESRASHSSITKPAVLGAIIDLGNSLDLIDARNLETVRSAYQRLEALMRETGQSMPKNTGRGFRARNLDCAVFEALHQSRNEELLEPFDTVRAFFVEGEPLYPGAGLRQLDHIQICLRNPSNIVGYFLPKLN